MSEYFEGMTDPRQEAKVKHSFIETIMIVICADAGEAARTLAERGLRPKVIVVDPPRKGMREEAIRAVASMAPGRVVYVSCEPGTLARDILRFNEYGYTLRAAEAYDLFPRTKHVETVVLLSKKRLDSCKSIDSQK